MKSNVAIMGAGPGGLASAMLLAAKGFKVDVYEKMDRVGGRTSAITEQGYTFDMGPTFFLYPQILREIFSQCGYDLDQEVEMVRLDPQYHIIFENQADLRATADIEKLKAEISRFAPEDAQNIEQFMADNRRKLELFEPILKRPFSKLTDLISKDTLKSLSMMRPHQSVDQDLQRYFKNPLTRLAFTFQSKYLGMSPFRCPSLFSILSFMEYEHGVYHPIGGCNAVMQAMARVAERMGVNIHLNTEVTQFNFVGKRVTGLHTDKGLFSCDQLVVNADFSHVMDRYVPDQLLSRWKSKKLAKKKFSCSTFMLYLGIKGSYDLEHHTIYLSEQYQDNIRSIEDGGTPPVSPSFYIQNASRTDKTLAPEGDSALYVLVPVANQQNAPVDWATQTAAYRADVIERLKVLGLDDLEDRIVYERCMTPDHWSDEMAVHYGATFNLAHSLDQMLMLRPQNRFNELDGVYLVGGGTHPGSGLPVIFEGARITSELLAQDVLSTNYELDTVSPMEAC